MAEKSIELDSVEVAAAVFGNCDCNIRLLEKEGFRFCGKIRYDSGERLAFEKSRPKG